MGPLSVGVNAKAVQAKLADVSATGVAADLGGIWTLQREVYGGTIRFGATVRNLGTGLKFIDQRDPFPMQWRLGAAAIHMAQQKLNVSFDVGKERDVSAACYSGLEYWIIPVLALRAGYVGTSQEGNGVRAGLGLKIRDFSFDYAYSAYGDLGMSHRYEISWRFGVIRPLLSSEEKAMLKRAKLAMAQGRYDEATMLFDSLITMEPNYRPARKYVKEAMRQYEGQEAAGQFSGSLVLHGKEAGDQAMDEKELTDLLQLSEDAEKVAAARGHHAPNAEENTLAPAIPSSPGEGPTP
jgi:tetratricopeptide (TPR) repeat protein